MEKNNSGLFTISLQEGSEIKKKKFNLSFLHFFVPIFAISSTLFLIFSLSFLFIFQDGGYAENIDEAKKIYSLFSSKPKILGESTLNLTEGDPRPAIIKQFFAKHKAPLSNYAQTIVAEADKYGIDWRLVPSIGMCESNGGKSIPEDSYNAWGWAASEKDLAEKSGNYNNGSWEAGIARVSKGLATGYYHLINPKDGIDFDEIWTIMKKYTPPSEAKGGPWAKCVWQYYEELTNFKSSL